MNITPPNLTSYQKAILFSPARFTICEASTKVGKTYSHIIWLFGKAMELQPKEGCNYWWVAPVYNQTKIAFKRLRTYLAPTRMFKFNETELRIDCPNGSFMFFKSAEKPDNLFGEDVYGAVFDEAPRARPEAWYALRSTLTATNAPCKLIGNFGGTANWMHQLKIKSIKDPSYEYFKITCHDAVKEGIITQEEVDQAQRDLPPKIFKELYLAEANEDEDRLISNEKILDLWTNDYVSDGNYYISADVARFGKDKTVIGLWSGLRLIKVITMDSSSMVEVANVINNLIYEKGIPKSNIVIDDDGVGGGCTDIIGGSVVGFTNNSSALKVEGSKQNYQNLKTQCYFELAQKIEKGELFFEVDDAKSEIIEELEMIRMKGIDRDNKLQIYSKDEIKKTIGRSPDYSDMIMMRMYFELSYNTSSFTFTNYR
jgi:hypothetical protein